MAEKEYIERGVLLRHMDDIEAFYAEPPVDDKDALIQTTLRKVIGEIKNFPAADVVEVVRCKDCAVPHNKWTGCPHLNGLIPPPNHYCARGERKEDEECATNHQ